MEPNPQIVLEKLSTTIHSTYLVRIQAQKRLSARSTAWNLSLIISSAGLLLASTRLLVFPVEHADLTTTMLSAVVLVASVWATSLNYGPRSRDMFWNYRQLQSLSKRVDQQLHFANSSPHQTQLTAEMILDFNKEYDSLLNGENQTSSDYLAKNISEQIKKIRAKQAQALEEQVDRLISKNDTSAQMDKKPRILALTLKTYTQQGMYPLLGRWLLTIAPVVVASLSVFYVVTRIS